MVARARCRVIRSERAPASLAGCSRPVPSGPYAHERSRAITSAPAGDLVAPLSPAELARAMDAYRASGTFAAAARAIGRDETGVRRALRRHLAPERAALFAEELETAHVNALRAVGKARRRASDALDTATDPRDLALLAHVAAEALRAVTAARTAHARLVAPSSTSTAAGRVVVVGYDDRPASELTDAELDAELDRHALVELRMRLARIRDAAGELVTTDAAELERLVGRAVSILAGRALQGDADARATVGALLDHATDASNDAAADGAGVVMLPPLDPPPVAVVELPRSLARPREEPFTTYPRERSP